MGSKSLHQHGKRQRFETGRSAKVTSPEQLENLQSLGRQALEEAAKSYEPPKTLGSADLSVDPVPVVQGNVSEQPVQRPQEDVVGNAIRMEAKLVCELEERSMSAAHCRC